MSIAEDLVHFKEPLRTTLIKQCQYIGVPLIDGGTVRLQAIVGLGRALDMILTGRAVNAKEAFEWGLANRIVACGTGTFYYI